MPWQHEHYDVGELENCSCHICSQWRERRQEYLQLREQTLRHSSKCVCAGCYRKRAAFAIFQALDIKRNLYSELSYVVQEERHRDILLDGVRELIMDDGIADVWWLTKAQSMRLKDALDIVFPLVFSGSY